MQQNKLFFSTLNQTLAHSIYAILSFKHGLWPMLQIAIPLATSATYLQECPVLVYQPFWLVADLIHEGPTHQRLVVSLERFDQTLLLHLDQLGVLAQDGHGPVKQRARYARLLLLADLVFARCREDNCITS